MLRGGDAAPQANPVCLLSTKSTNLKSVVISIHGSCVALVQILVIMAGHNSTEAIYKCTRAKSKPLTLAVYP